MPRKRKEGEEVQLHSFLTSALDGGEWLTLRSGRLTTRKSWVGHRARLDVLEKRKISRLENQNVQPVKGKVLPRTGDEGPEGE
jgi:hypothetical protein